MSVAPWGSRGPEADRVFLTSGATSPKLPGQVPEFLFLARFGDNVQAAAGAEWAYRQLGERTALVLHDPDQTYLGLELTGEVRGDGSAWARVGVGVGEDLVAHHRLIRVPKRGAFLDKRILATDEERRLTTRDNARGAVAPKRRQRGVEVEVVAAANPGLTHVGPSTRRGASALREIGPKPAESVWEIGSIP
jgi:hypothetical protein